MPQYYCHANAATIPDVSFPQNKDKKNKIKNVVLKGKYKRIVVKKGFCECIHAFMRRGQPNQ
jgi:hypothetical protein